MGSVLVPPIVALSLLFSITSLIVHGGIPTTLDGPFKPVTVPLDKTFRGNAVDLPDTDPLVQRTVEGFEPEQISLSLSASHDSVWISWITGTHYLPSSFHLSSLLLYYLVPRPNELMKQSFFVWVHLKLKLVMIIHLDL